MLAPANGIEGVVVSFINMLDAQTYEDLYEGIETMAGMDYKDWCAAWHTLKFTYENMSTSDKIAPIISLLTGVVFLVGGTAKLFEIMNKLKYPAKTKTLVKNIIEGAVIARSGARPLKPLGEVLPVATIVGITLKYINLESK